MKTFVVGKNLVSKNIVVGLTALLMTTSAYAQGAGQGTLDFAQHERGRDSGATSAGPERSRRLRGTVAVLRLRSAQASIPDIRNGAFNGR